MTFQNGKVVGQTCAHGPGAQAEDAASDLHVVCCEACRVERHGFLDAGGGHACEAAAPDVADPSPSFTESQDSQDPSSHDTSLPEA